MSRPKKITINWSRPIPWDERDLYEAIETGPGVYAISRIFGNKETLLYIGETKRESFKKRMDEHVTDHNKGKEEFLNLRGRKYVRFGHIDGFQGYDEITMKRILRNTETHLIWNYNPQENRKQLATATIWKQLDITNRGSSWIFSRKTIRNTDNVIFDK